jgi:DNA-binding NarL/FixJ family response regulator
MRPKGGVPKEIELIAGRAPRGLSVDRLEIGSDELAVFQWDIADLAAERAAATLTSAERAVLDLVVRGASNAEIARTRGSSIRTVANQVASLLRKLAATSRFELVRRYGRSCASRHAT